MTSAPRGLRERVESLVREVLTGLGLDEAVTFSLVDETLAAPVGPGAAGSRPLRIDHSSRKREVALRQSLIPSLLSVRRHNEAHGNPDAELFEIANVYLPRAEETLPDEPTRLGIISGRDFRGLKGLIEALLARLHVATPLSSAPVETPLLASGRAAELRLGETHLGYLGEVDDAQLAALDLRASCTAAELDFTVLMNQARLVPQHHSLPPFPAVVRDLSLVVPRSLSWADLSSAAVASAGPLLSSIEYLDTFQGGNLPADEQSVHFGLTFRHPERTLTGEEVEQSVKAVVEACASRFGAECSGSRIRGPPIRTFCKETALAFKFESRTKQG